MRSLCHKLWCTYPARGALTALCAMAIPVMGSICSKGSATRTTVVRCLCWTRLGDAWKKPFAPQVEARVFNILSLDGCVLLSKEQKLAYASDLAVAAAAGALASGDQRDKKSDDRIMSQRVMLHSDVFLTILIPFMHIRSPGSDRALMRL